jgi:hypothetical protein
MTARLILTVVLIVVFFLACGTMTWLGFDRQAMLYPFIACWVIYWSWVAFPRP